MNRPNVVALSRENSGVTYHRIESPLKHLQSLGEIDLTLVYDFKEINSKMLNDCTHFIASRFIPSKRMFDTFQYLKSIGITVIIDQDDHWDLPKHHPAKTSYDKALKSLILHSCKLADEVWVTHSELAKHIPNSNVRIIPNAINHHEPQWQIKKKSSEEIRFGYIGGISHREDLISAKIDLEKSLNGYCANVEDYPILINAGRILATKPINEYAELYSHIDVSLIPLQQTSFNRCKSNLKLLEAGFTGTAAIVSHVFPYTQIIKDDNCISLPRGGDWNKVIKSLSWNEVEDMAANLKEDTWEYRMDVINEQRINRLNAHIKRNSRKAG